MKRLLHILLTVILLGLLSSCASLARYPGVGRIKHYTFASPQLPEAFDSFRVAFASDFHYKSKFGPRQLANTVRALQSVHPDLLLLGGDYQEGCEYVEPLFAALAQVKAPYGTFGVLGNHDYAYCTDEVRSVMEHYGMQLLEHSNDTIHKDGQMLIISGVRNPFDLRRNGVAPTASLTPNDFVILLTHTPDYIEDVNVPNVDLALAGHTHGGQVTFLRWIVPQTGSKYGRRFLSGLNYSSRGVPVITTNGLGTSRKRVRFCARSEIVVITLRREVVEE